MLLKVVSGRGINESEGATFFVRHSTQKRYFNGRFTSLLQTMRAMEVVPVAGYGVPSTKFNLLFNPESNSYQYVVKTKKVLESMKRARISDEDKMHYELLLKKLNAELNND